MSKRIYLVKNNETGSEELVKHTNGAAALRHLLTVRNTYSVKIPTVEEALAIQKTGQEVLDPDNPDSATLQAIAAELKTVPSLVLHDPFSGLPAAGEPLPMSLQAPEPLGEVPPAPTSQPELSEADLENIPF